MKVKITYATPSKRKLQRARLIQYLAGPFLLAALICGVVNLTVGGKAWSLIVMWALYMVWTMIVSPDVIEYNRISQFTKLLWESCVLLILIDVLLVSGWVLNVVSIVCFGGIIAVCALFLTDYERQRHNLLPVILLSVGALVASVLGIIIIRPVRWQISVTAALSFAMLVVCLYGMRHDIKSELRKMFHVR